LCHELCRTEVDAILSKLKAGTDVCEGDELRKAVSCMHDTEEQRCISSLFSTQDRECDNKTTRVLEMSEDDVELSENAVEHAELSVNQTRSLGLKSMVVQGIKRTDKFMDDMGEVLEKARKYGAKVGQSGSKYLSKWKDKAVDLAERNPKTVANIRYATDGVQETWQQKRDFQEDSMGMICFSERLVPYMGVYMLSKEIWGLGVCVAMKWENEAAGSSFSLEFGWAWFSPKAATFYVKMESCVDILKTAFKIPPPIYAKKCVGGQVIPKVLRDCPEVGIYFMRGKAFMKLDVGVDLWVWKLSLMEIEIGIEVGIESGRKFKGKCWWKWNNGSGRRRWWTLRRRNIRKCNYYYACDVYLKGYAKLTFGWAGYRIKLEMVYYFRSKEVEIKFIVDYDYYWSGWGEWKSSKLWSTKL